MCHYPDTNFGINAERKLMKKALRLINLGSGNWFPTYVINL